MLPRLEARDQDCRHRVDLHREDSLEQMSRLYLEEQAPDKVPQDPLLDQVKAHRDLHLDPQLPLNPAAPQSRSSHTRMSTTAMEATNGAMSQRTESKPRRLEMSRTKAPTMPFRRCREATRTHRPKAKSWKFLTLPTRTVFKRKVNVARFIKARVEAHITLL
jgi:hypothetical protein